MATLEITVKVNNDGSVELKKVANSAKEAENAVKSLEKSNQSLSASFFSLKNAIVAVGMSALARETIKMADTYKLMQGRLSLVTSSTENLIAVQNQLFKVAQESRVGYEATVDLYARIARSTESLGVSQKDLLSVTETINKSFIISGASAQSAESAIIQLGQAFASGTLRGDELNSIMEQSPRLAEAIAKGMNVTVGQLRALGAEGKITSEAVFKAIREQGEAIEKEFAKMPTTVGQALTTVQNSLIELVGTTDSATGTTDDLVEAMNKLAETISDNKVEIVEFGKDTFRAFQLMGTGVMMVGTSIEIVANAIPKSLIYALGLGTLKIQEFLNGAISASESTINQLQSLYGGDKVKFDRLNFAKPMGGNPFKTQMEELNIELQTAKGLYNDIANMTTVVKKSGGELEGPGKKEPTPGAGKTKAELAKELREYQKMLTETDNIQNEIYKLNHTESENEIRDIENKAKAYREAKVDEGLITQFVADSKKKLKEKEVKDHQDAVDAMLAISADSLTKQEKDDEIYFQSKLDAQKDLVIEMNMMMGNLYDNELIRIAEVAQKKAEAGVDSVEIIKYVEKAQKKAYNDLGIGMIEAVDVARNAVMGLENALVDAFMTGKFEARKMFEAIASDIARLVIRQAITAPIASGIAGAFASANGNAFIGGQPVHAFADGGAFTNSVVSSPTVAPMALFGEAGPEAIMPLQRTSDGKLGVVAMNKNDSQNIKVEIINQSGQEVQATQSTSRFDGENFVISVVIDAIRRNRAGMRDIVSGGR